MSGVVWLAGHGLFTPDDARSFTDVSRLHCEGYNTTYRQIQTLNRRRVVQSKTKECIFYMRINVASKIKVIIFVFCLQDKRCKFKK